MPSVQSGGFRATTVSRDGGRQRLIHSAGGQSRLLRGPEASLETCALRTHARQRDALSRGQNREEGPGVGAGPACPNRSKMAARSTGGGAAAGEPPRDGATRDLAMDFTESEFYPNGVF